MDYYSYSQLRLYKECPLKYFIKYHMRVGEGDRIEFKIGKAFHKGMETLFIDKSFDKAKGVFRDRIKSIDPKLLGAQDNNLALNMHTYYKHIFPFYEMKHTDCEYQFFLKLPELSKLVMGYIDHMFVDGFIDIKTYSESLKESFDPLQMAIYKLAYIQKTGVAPVHSQIHGFSKTSVQKNLVSDFVLDYKDSDFSSDLVVGNFLAFERDINNKRFSPNFSAWENESDSNIVFLKDYLAKGYIYQATL